jgi:hypothetical protein
VSGHDYYEEAEMTTTIAGRMQIHTVTGGGGVRLHVRE